MASPNVSFSQIPASIRKPGVYIEFNSSLAVRSLPSNRQRVRLIGQRRSTGLVLAGVPTQLASDADAGSAFGYGSHIHLMARALLKANPYADVHAIAVDDAAGAVAASGTVTLSGTATAAGAVVLRVGATDVRAAVASGDTAATVAAALNTALAAVPELPVTAGVAGAVVTVTAKCKGPQGNDIKLAARLEAATGLAAAVVAMANGSGSPDIATTLAAVQAAGDDIIVCSLTDASNLTKLRTHLAFVGNGVEQRGAIAVIGSAASYGTTVALAATINDARIVLSWLPSTGSQPLEIAGAMAGLLAFEEDPARPLNGLQLPALDAPPVASRPTRTDIEGCLANGVTPLAVGPGERVQVVRAITTYTLNAAGVTDVAWLDVTTVRTMDYLRKALRTRLALRFPRDKATARTLARIRSEVIEVLGQLESLEIVENVRANLPAVIVELDSQEVGRANVRVPADVVNGLHVIAGVVDLIL